MSLGVAGSPEERRSMSSYPVAAPRILIADDQEDVREALSLLLTHAGFAVTSANSPSMVVAALSTSGAIDVVLLDMNFARDTTSGREGLDLLGRLREERPRLPVVVMTAWGSVQGAVDAMRCGAKDYVQKPWDNVSLLSTLRTHAQTATQSRESVE